MGVGELQVHIQPHDRDQGRGNTSGTKGEESEIETRMSNGRLPTR